MRYLPHTDDEITEMLRIIGKESVDDLFVGIPEEARMKGDLDIPAPMAEADLMRHLKKLGSKNQQPQMLSFLGAGCYAHHIPPAVDQLLLRSEFYTAYTPYQPEVAQGTLQAIWEFQTVVSELYGLPLATASMYDGASATAEAAQMARRLTKRDTVLVSGCVHPNYREVTKTYLSGRSPDHYADVAVGSNGACDLDAIQAALNDNVAAVVVGYPSFTGQLRDLTPLAKMVHDAGALLVASNSEPYALALAKAPGQMDVDIAAGEGQALASPPNYGGPYVGLFACRHDRKFQQQLPGRVCGETKDVDGKRGFVLTLSTREQHIRRERATSNICTNQGLIALSLLIRTSMLGKKGFRLVAEQCLAKTRYLRSAILKLDGYESGTTGQLPVFNEFCVKVRGDDAAKVCASAEKAGIVAGLDMGRVDPERRDQLLIAVTEQHTRSMLDELVAALSSI